MCGLAGFWDASHALSDDDRLSVISRMADALRHRGPDDRGLWTDPPAGLALGFRRLAIVDLSPEGRQPMLSGSGRYVLAFNGEVYNFLDLRKELEQEGCAAFRGRSDTEVMLACFERWGVERSLQRFSGMFAFALWDRAERRLYLARDRMGEKPLYHGWMGQTFLFGSELKSLRCHPQFRATVDRATLALYARHGYIPAPYTIFEGIHKLPPASLAILGPDQVGIDPEPQAYWSLRQAAETGTSHPFAGGAHEAASHLEQILRKVIRREMIADVPLGAFLSGGVDSSTVVALMQAESARPVKTFTIGFSEAEYDEAVHAKAVARHLGTEHTELYVSSEQARAVIPRLPELFDEPYADSSAIPTFLVSEMARRDVTVSLSGDGGDELFAGYPWYPRTSRIWHRLRATPLPFRRAAVAIMGRRSTSSWNTFLGAVRPALLPAFRRYASGDRVRKFVELMGGVDRPERLHWLFTTHWDPAELLKGDAAEPFTAFVDGRMQADLAESVDRLMCLDQVTYLPDDIMTKVDRASMAVSLESRAPLLDHDVVELAWSIPSSWKLREGRSKWLLRQLLYRHVPEELIERPKMGFSIPLDVWLRGPLLDWAESLLGENRLRSEGFFNPGPIRRRWREHVEGSRDWSGSIWVVLMFQAWLGSIS